MKILITQLTGREIIIGRKSQIIAILFSYLHLNKVSHHFTMKNTQMMRMIRIIQTLMARKLSKESIVVWTKMKFINTRLMASLTYFRTFLTQLRSQRPENSIVFSRLKPRCVRTMKRKESSQIISPKLSTP
jgi:hypothetical protein